MGNTLAVTERARARWDDAQVALIRRTVAADCNDGELALFLELAARYELDPFAKQVWAVKIDGRVQVIVSRDGLLSVANRYSDFLGCQSFEIREHDSFEVNLDENGHCHVTHRWLDADGKPSHGGQDGSLRGELVGAFAYVRREGRVDTQFMAYRKQYDKGKHTWASHPSAMMIKVAEAMALRKAFSITGVLGEGEVTPDAINAPQPPERIPEPLDWGDDEQLAESLKEACRKLGYRRTKVRTLLRGCETRDDRVELLARLMGDMADADAITAAAAEVITDAVVVEEEPAA